MAGERAHLAVEAHVRQVEDGVEAVGVEDAVPAVHAGDAVGHVLAAQVGVERRQRGQPGLRQAAVLDPRHDGDGLGEQVVVLAALLLPASLQPGRVVVRHVGGGLSAEQVEAHAVVEVDVLLDDVQRDATIFPDIVVVVLAHQLRRPLHHPVHARGAHEHVVGLLLEHELARPAERVERRLLERAELVLAVAVGEVREHEERQPVRRLLVEGAQDARRVLAARVAQQQRLGLVPAGPAEVGVQQVDHGPQVPALLHVDLEEVAQVVQGRGAQPEPALLLDAGRLGVALDDDEPLQVGTVLAGHLLPDRLPLVLAEGDAPVGVALGQEDAPAVFGQRHVVEVRPALTADGDGGAQVDVLGGQRRAHLRPPLQEPRLPRLQRPLQPPVLGQVDVVRDPLGVVDAHARLRWLVMLARGRRRGAGRCRSCAGRPRGPRRSGG